MFLDIEVKYQLFVLTCFEKHLFRCRNTGTKVVQNNVEKGAKQHNNKQKVHGSQSSPDLLLETAVTVVQDYTKYTTAKRQTGAILKYMIVVRIFYCHGNKKG